MRVIVERVSQRNKDDSPCENARNEGEYWTVEIESIEEFMREQNEDIIVSQSGVYFNEYSITLMIYDGYIE